MNINLKGIFNFKKKQTVNFNEIMDIILKMSINELANDSEIYFD